MWDKVKKIDKDLEYLKQISHDVDLPDENLEDEIRLLKEFSKETGCLAMAAIQLGIPKRLIYARNTNLNDLENRNLDEGIVLINPKIISMKGHTRYWEACASCLDNMALVDRPYEIVIEYYDGTGQKRTRIFTDFEAVVFAHEYDHLDGILHMDRAIQIYNLPQDKRKEFREVLPNHGHQIISKEGEFKYKEMIYEKVLIRSML